MTSVEWVDGKVRFIDQTRLPAEEVYVETTDYRVVGEAIKKLQIRGAPAIGVATGFALLLAVHDRNILTPGDLHTSFDTACNFLSRTRPTAVNLFASINRMKKSYERVLRADISSIRDTLLDEARTIHREDIEACRKIGENGAALLSHGSTVLTHCNTGALATTGEGTAQSVITTAARQGKIARVYVDETRPLFQGARLTSWELVRNNIEAVLITDSTAAYVMQQRQVSAVLVGADRIAANGDTANKVGTYGLAVIAQRHGVPFYVAAPVSTIDVSTACGKDIPVEERSAEEVTHVRGMRIAAEGVKVYAPAFDVTPNELITAIVTDAGVLKHPLVDAIAALRLRSGRDRGTA